MPPFLRPAFRAERSLDLEFLRKNEQVCVRYSAGNAEYSPLASCQITADLSHQRCGRLIVGASKRHEADGGHRDHRPRNLLGLSNDEMSFVRASAVACFRMRFPFRRFDSAFSLHPNFCRIVFVFLVDAHTE